MLETQKMVSGGYYLLESLSCGRNCYFETNEESRLFKVLFKRYLKCYSELHKIYMSSEGYHVLMRIRSKEIVIRNYIEERIKRKKEINSLFLEEPWRIISEQVRILHSVYVKMVNRLRGRQGVLVQKRYRRYYFEGKDEYYSYEKRMKGKEMIEGQKSKRYRVSDRWKKGVDWVVVRGVLFVESLMDMAFQNHVVSKLVKSTLIAHSPPP